MSETDYDRTIEEIDRLLNDPDRRMEADRVWRLLDEVARYHAGREG